MIGETFAGKLQRIETNLEINSLDENYPKFSLGIEKQLLPLFLHSILCLGHSKR